MSIYESIMGKIFGAHKTPAAPVSAPGSTTAAAATAPASNPAAAGSSPASVATAAPNAPAGSVDVTAILDTLNERNPQTLDWRKSIVDLMKLLGLDSSLTARKDLASELHYTGDTDDSASMNIWLHKEIMTKIAANGGKVPADLTH
jgi:3-oxoacyl-ACP reductase-like protein